MILKEAISRKKWCVVGSGDDGKGFDPHKGGCENIRTGHDSPLYTCCRQDEDDYEDNEVEQANKRKTRLTAECPR